MLKKTASKWFSRYPVFIVIFLRLRYVFSAADDFIKKISKKLPVLYYLEVHVADHCNLNCKGCSHFCNLIKSENFPSLDQYAKDITRLSGLFGNIRTVTLMGGEPLLNKELPGFIRETRKVFPDSNIHVLTNGLLYKQINAELADVIKGCGAVLRVSRYKPVEAHIGALESHLEALGVNYHISQPIAKFARFINPRGSSDYKKRFWQCSMAKCTFVENGHISCCGLPSRIRNFKEYFNFPISMEQDLIDIHNPDIDGFELKKIMMKPIKSCRYCGKMEWFDWGMSGSDIRVEDFCV